MSARLMEMLQGWHATDERVASRTATPTPGTTQVDQAMVAEARTAYERMHGHPPSEVLQMPVRCVGRVAASLGPTVAIEYMDGSQVRRLEFPAPGPELAFDEIDRSLHLVSGGKVLQVGRDGWLTGGLPAGLGPREIGRARAAYRDTHGGREPERITVAEIPCARGPLVAFGPVVAVEYLADKGDGVHTYRHVFRSTPPQLAVDLVSNHLHLVLGSYTVTSHGVEDTMQSSEYAVVANPAGPGELGLHPHLRRPTLDNPDGESTGVGATLVTIAFGLGGALIIAWGTDKLVESRGWTAKTGAWIKLATAAVVGIGVYMKWPVLGLGLGLAGGSLGLAGLLAEWRSESSGAGLPAGEAPAGELPSGSVFTPYQVPGYARQAA